MYNVCRICLTENISKDIFSLPSELNVQKTANEVMKFCLDIELLNDSKLHSSLCEQCHSSIIIFYKFKQLALQTDQRLKSQNQCKNEEKASMLCSFSIKSDLDDIVVKYEKDPESEPESEPECYLNYPCHDEESSDIKEQNTFIKEPNTDEEDAKSYETVGIELHVTAEPPKQAPKPKVGRPRKYPEGERSPEQECQVCGKMVKHLRQHMNVHIQKEKKILCKACGATFSELTCLEEHYQNNHKDWESCVQCNKYFPDPKSLAKHTKRYHNQRYPKVIPCEFCQKMFGSSHALERHLPQHVKEKRFYCNDCDKSFYGKLAIEKHIRIDHLKESCRIKCPDCDKVFSSKRHMKRHHLRHTTISATNTIGEECPICGKTYRQLKEHMARHQPSSARLKHQCKLCNKKFVSAPYMKRHHDAVHMRKKVKCHICQKEVQRLATHILLEHSSKQFACDHCPRRFALPSLLKLHLIAHSNERPHECTQCDGRFKRIEGLQMHMSTVHGGEKKFLCQICSRTYARKCRLDKHLQTHATERKFKCELCKKMLKTSESLRVHMLRHEGVEKHLCPICDRGFVISSALRSHMKSHTKEKNYQCRFCEARFGRSDHRTRHERTAHLRCTEPSKEAADLAT